MNKVLLERNEAMTPLTKAKALVEDNCVKLLLKLIAKKTGRS